jgi:predicted secreted Zn-dependent protease
MKSAVFTALLVGFTLAQAVTAQSFPAVQVQDEQVRYAITAGTSRGINAQLRDYAKSATLPEHGHTRSHLELTSALDAKSDRCTLATLTVTVHVSTALPEWKPPLGVTAAVEREWRDAFAQLQRHEAGHRANALAGARKLRENLLDLAPEKTCMRMQVTLSQQVEKYQAQTTSQDNQYDVRTQHGLRDDPWLEHPPRNDAFRLAADTPATEPLARRRGHRSQLDKLYSSFGQ